MTGGNPKQEGKRPGDAANGDRIAPEARALVRALLDAQGDVSFLVTPDLRIVEASETAAALVGLPREKIIGREAEAVFAHFTREVRDGRVAAVRRAIESGETLTVEDERNGRHFRNIIRPVPGEGDAVRHVVICARDITGQRMAEEALRRSEITYRQLVERLGEGILIVVDRPIRFLFANPAMERIVGRPFEKMQAMTERDIMALVHPDDLEMLLGRLRMRLAGEEPPRRTEFRTIGADGAVTWLSVVGQVIEYRGERAILASFSDVTRRKEAEQALQAKEEQSRTQFLGIPIPTYTWRREDGDFVLVDYNDAAMEHSGGHVASLTGARASEILAGRPDIIADFERCFEERSSFEREIPDTVEMPGRGESIISLKCAFVPPDLVMVHAEDITERKRVEGELARYRERLEEMIGERTASLRREISEREKVEDELERRNRELAALIDINRILNESGETTAGIGTALARVMRFIGSSKGVLYRLDRERKIATLVSSVGIPPEIEARIVTVPVDDMPPGFPADGEALVFEAGDRPCFHAEPYEGFMADIDIGKWLSFITSSGGAPVHVVFLGLPDGVVVTDEMRNFLGLVAAQLGLAMGRIALLHDLMARERDLKNLSANLIESLESERRALALRLHDDMGQSFVALNANFGVLETRIPRGDREGESLLSEITEELRKITHSTRQIAYALHPAMLEDLGLVPALESYIEKFVESDTLEVEMEAVGFDEQLSPATALTLYRVAQEALTNVVRHAEASRVSIRLTKGYPRVIMTIADNGRGVTEGENGSMSGLGIVGMRERVKSLGGDFSIHVLPEGGTRIRVTIPVEDDDER